MVRKGWVFGILIIVVTMLSGCMYPQDQRKENQVNFSESVLVVQAAVDSYQEKDGILPIKNSDMGTPKYEKYVIDLEKLVRTLALGRIPSSAFEQGGNYYYVLVDVETNPTVKLMDITTIQKLGEIQSMVDEYIRKHQKIPGGEPMQENWYRLDKDVLPKLPDVKSVFSGQYSSIIIHQSGEVVADYALDIMQVLQKEGISNPDPNTDLRKFLVEYSFFVPVPSYPYFWEDNEPKIQAPANFS